MEVNKHNSTKLCPSVYIALTICRRKVGGRPSQKILGPKKIFYICSDFQRLWDLMAYIFLTKREIDNQTRALERTRGLLRSRKISWTSVHKQVKMVPEFLSTICIFSVLLRCQASHTANETQPNIAKGWEVNGADASWVRWRHIVNVYETIDIRSLVSRGPTNILC